MTDKRKHIDVRLQGGIAGHLFTGTTVAGNFFCVVIERRLGNATNAVRKVELVLSVRLDPSLASVLGVHTWSSTLCRHVNSQKAQSQTSDASTRDRLLWLSPVDRSNGRRNGKLERVHEAAKLMSGSALVRHTSDYIVISCQYGSEEQETPLPRKGKRKSKSGVHWLPT